MRIRSSFPGTTICLAWDAGFTSRQTASATKDDAGEEAVARPRDRSASKQSQTYLLPFGLDFPG